MEKIHQLSIKGFMLRIYTCIEISISVLSQGAFYCLKKIQHVKIR